MAQKHKPMVPLTSSQLCVACDASGFKFKTTKELPSFAGLIGQKRALDAISMAAKIRHHDFNLFVLGSSGSGRHTALRELLRQQANNCPVSSDWVYVNNFETPEKPLALKLPAGEAMRLKATMEALVDDLANNIPALFESDDYQTRRGNIEQEFAEKHEHAFSELGARASAKQVTILRTPMGFAVAALHNGDVIKPDDYEALPEDEQRQIDDKIDEIQKELEAVLKEVPRDEKQHRHAVEELNAQMAEQGVEASFGDVETKFKNVEAAYPYLKSVRADLIANADIFLNSKPAPQAGAFPVATSKHYAKPQFQRYAVNVMVSNDPEGISGAPVEIEDMPTLANLLGRIEHVSEMGALRTDFTMIKPGALHRANDGYLILDAQQVLTEPFAWDALKRCLKTGSISIVSASERFSLITTTSLQPDPIPLNVRVALVGERFLYYMLAALDPDFQKLFKVQADFNDTVTRSDENTGLYAGMIASIAQRENLKALNPKAVARLLQEGTRLVDDNERLSLNIGQLSDILREADYWAGETNRKIISSKDIDKAIDEAEQRASRIRELSQETITRGTMLIDTDDQTIGQINALSVLEIGNFRFGRPSRVTVKTRMGSGKVIDIEREVELGGPLHSKGVMILSGYLAANYALDVPVSLWASIVFEQSYGGVDGDSASAAELFALLSSLGELPIDQSFAVTGSVNQHGEIQAIGGINEKIEGYFDVCAARGLTGRQGILMPATNVKNLALRDRVVEAVKKKKFRIIPIETIDQGIEILTGNKAGRRRKNGSFPENSVNGLAEARLRDFALRRAAFAKSAQNGKADGKEDAS